MTDLAGGASQRGSAWFRPGRWKHPRGKHRRGPGAVALLAAVLLGLASPVLAQDGLPGGAAFVTKFSGTATVETPDGPRTVIDVGGTSGVALDLRTPGFAADGRHWLNEPHLFEATAADVGQVFGVALDDASPPSIYLTATSAFGLHRTDDTSGWMDGQWGAGGGPGTIYRLAAADGYRPEPFAEVTLDGRGNTGASLGNIAFDPWRRQLYVSDLETGLIHRLAIDSGAELGRYDHGVEGRASFTDALTGATLSLPTVAFDPASAARIDDCPTGDFARTPSCWNFADFRRRVWGLNVRRDAGSGEVRLYYAVWGSQGFGNPDWAAAGEDQQNSVWSVAVAEDGSFVSGTVRREFLLPEFFRSPEAIARAGISHPVADIAFPLLAEPRVMLLAERGGVRNLGLAADDSFAYPREARVLRYELDAAGVWQPAGRYDLGFYDRSTEGPPYLRAGAAGGVAFGQGYGQNGEADQDQPDAFVWMTGDALCTPDDPCLDPATGGHDDASEVTGLQGIAQSAFEEIVPEAAFRPYPSPGPATPATGPDQAYMVDVDANADASGAPIPEELTRNDATRIGDVAVYQPPAPKILDLSIVKRAAARSCSPGGVCPFAVTIENVGEAPYAGPLVVSDIPDNGGTMTVPPADWACETLYPGVYQCTLAEATLAPGESLSFEASFLVPDWWDQPVFANCVELIAPGSGEDDRTYNNEACGYAPTAQPGTPYYAPDLRLTKYGLDGQCDWADNCLFVVRITNVGAASYIGSLTFHDEVDFAGAAFGAWAPAPEWSCAPVGGDAFGCSHPPVTLSPGESREVTLWVGAPPPTPGQTQVRNCAWIDWGGSPSDYNPANDYDCATISRYPPGHPGAFPALDVAKDAAPTCWPPAGPGTGWLCAFEIVVTNVGGAPHYGPIEVDDGAGIGPHVLGDYSTPPWTCVPGTGTPGNRTCSRPGVPGGLQPGESVRLVMEFAIPAAVPPGGGFGNCATVHSDHNGDGVAEDHISCDIAPMCEAGSPDCPRDLALTKGASLDPCFPGFPCYFGIGVTNISDQVYPGPIVFADLPDPGMGPVVAAPADLVCVPAGAGGYTCTWPHDLLPGAQVWISLEFPIPAGHPGPSFTNCASVAPSAANVLAFNDEDCAVAFVPFPDLAPFSPSSCQRGSSCVLDVRIDNKGLLPFFGSAGLNGSLSPAVTITSIASKTPGMVCNVTGTGLYQCQGAGLEIPPGAAAELTMTVDIPADFGSDTITHTKDMVWPDRAVKDKRPENDRHVSTITIEGPKEEPPPPPPPEPPPPPPPGPAAGADLALLKTADRTTCVAGEPCRFTLTVTNAGTGVFTGPITISDVTTPANTRLTASGPSPWSCRGSNGTYTCTHPRTTIAPGASKALSLTLATARTAKGSLNNCGSFQWSDAARIFAVQAALNDLGFPSGAPDGKLGPQTRGAIEAYQESAGLPATGQINDALLTRLFGSWGVGDANAGNDRSCNAVTLKTPPPPPPPPKITCTNGTISGNQCLCPAGTVRQPTGTNAWRCVKPEPEIVCRGGTIKDNECICPRGTELVQTKPNTYSCVKPPSEIVCRGGDVVGNKCVCPEGTVRQQTGTNAWRCVEPEPEIVCRGGSIVDNECICPRGTELVQTKPNTYRCVKPEPQIVCKGGSIKNNKCVCPKGTEVVQFAPNAFQCVKPEPQIVCRHGTIKDNECVCPRGTEIRQTGPNAYICVEPEPQLVCDGGSIKKNQCVCPKGASRVQTGPNAYACLTVQTPKFETQPEPELPQLQMIPVQPLIVPKIE